MKKMLKRFIKDERGLEASEYALLLAIICVLVVGAILALKDQIVAAFENATTAMTGVDPLA